MVQRIRVTQIKVYEYEPDFTEDAYNEAGIKTFEDALAFDQKDYEEGKIELDDLGYGLPVVSAAWEIIDVPKS